MSFVHHKLKSCTKFLRVNPFVAFNSVTQLLPLVVAILHKSRDADILWNLNIILHFVYVQQKDLVTLGLVAPDFNNGIN